MFKIYSKTGVFLCFQGAKSEKDAIDFARMYGHRRAYKAVMVD